MTSMTDCQIIEKTLSSLNRNDIHTFNNVPYSLNLMEINERRPHSSFASSGMQLPYYNTALSGSFSESQIALQSWRAEFHMKMNSRFWTRLICFTFAIRHLFGRDCGFLFYWTLFSFLDHSQNGSRMISFLGTLT